MKTLTKDRAKFKAQQIKKTLNEFGYDVSLSHSYELLSRQTGFENWNALSASLDKPVKDDFLPFEQVMLMDTNQLEENKDSVNPVLHTIIDHALKDDPIGGIPRVGEGKFMYEITLECPAKASRWLEVKGDSPKHAHANLINHFDKMDDYEFFDHNAWSVDTHDFGTSLEQVDKVLFNPDKRFRNAAVIEISRYDKGVEVCAMQNDEGINEFCQFDEDAVPATMKVNVDIVYTEDENKYQAVKTSLEKMLGGHWYIDGSVDYGRKEDEIKDEYESGTVLVTLTNTPERIERMREKIADEFIVE